MTGGGGLSVLGLVLALTVPSVAVAQTVRAETGLSVSLRPLARPDDGARSGTQVESAADLTATDPEGQPVADPDVLDGVGNAALIAPLRPRARLILAPGRPETRPPDVVPQPVSLFLRRGGMPLSPLVDHLSTRSIGDLPVLTPVRTVALMGFLPPSPVRRPLVPVPIPVVERRTEWSLAVSPETAALAGLIRAAVERDRAARQADAERRAATPPQRPLPRPSETQSVPLTQPTDDAEPAPDAGTPPLRPVVRPASDEAPEVVPEAVVEDAALSPAPPAPYVEEDGYTQELIEHLLAGEPMVYIDEDVTELAVAEAPRPPDRPESIAEIAAAAEREAAAIRASLVRGSVCGTIDIQGVVRGNVSGPGACGVDDAVEVRSVAGVRLTRAAVVDCQTATALRDWTVNAAIPRFADTGGGLASIQIMGAYSCRGRNNVAGARLSEHAFGRAVDIGGFTLRNGNSVSVLTGWNGGRGETLRALHRAACRLFGTVLGPDANAAHRDHFHFDTARYRSGSYCR